jgi:hypothetical protein
MISLSGVVFHAREYHNKSRAVRQTSRKPREDCESDTTPASPFGGNATRSVSANAARGGGRAAQSPFGSRQPWLRRCLLGKQTWGSRTGGQWGPDCPQSRTQLEIN